MKALLSENRLLQMAKNYRWEPLARCFPNRFLAPVLLLFLSGCSSYGVVHNNPEIAHDPHKPYSVKTWTQARPDNNFLFVLAFSGGGTRAAAMAYGVLQELRDTPYSKNGEPGRLLDQVTHISSVSGGSFTSAYYGLYGDKIFEDFETEFLRKNVEKHLTAGLFDPAHWFTRKGRTERAIEYYNKILFHDATFADMLRTDRPMIVINSSDLAYGIRFSFIQDYFSLLCSDLLNFPVAAAVAASSAVPVVFNPVVVENYSGCPEVTWPERTDELAKQSDEVYQMLVGLNSYRLKEDRKYVHFVDGGITDNMGLLAMPDVVTLSGGPSAMINKLHRKIPRHIVFLSINASTVHRSNMDKDPKQPSILASMNAVTDVQLHRYNAATVDTVKTDLENWTKLITTPEHPVDSYFIEVSFEQVPQPELKLFLNKIPTSFSLNSDQVDALISSARSILKNDPEYQRLLGDIAKKGTE